MSGARSTHRRNERRIQHFGWETYVWKFILGK